MYIQYDCNNYFYNYCSYGFTHVYYASGIHLKAIYIWTEFDDYIHILNWTRNEAIHRLSFITIYIYIDILCCASVHFIRFIFKSIIYVHSRSITANYITMCSISDIFFGVLIFSSSILSYRVLDYVERNLIIIEFVFIYTPHM